MERIVQLRPYGLQFYHARNFPYGLKCMSCSYTFTQEGEPIAEILTHHHQQTPVVELVCMPCAKASGEE